MTVKNPRLLPLFADLKGMLEPLADRFTVRNAEDGRYELWSEVNIAPAGKPKHEPFFVGLIVQKSYTGGRKPWISVRFPSAWRSRDPWGRPASSSWIRTETRYWSINTFSHMVPLEWMPASLTHAPRVAPVGG